jgi:hypothetical protein
MILEIIIHRVEIRMCGNLIAFRESGKLQSAAHIFLFLMYIPCLMTPLINQNIAPNYWMNWRGCGIKEL